MSNDPNEPKKTMFETEISGGTVGNVVNVGQADIVNIGHTTKNKIFHVVIGVLTAIVLGTVFYVLLPRNDIYRVRVTVIDPERVPVEDAKVWSDFGGEPKRVAGGWQFDIPRGSVPLGKDLTVYASRESAFLRGEAKVKLDKDPNPNTTILLMKNDTARVRGIVVDEKGHALEGVRVSVVGYDLEAVATSPGGNFDLLAHAATGQQTLLHAEKDGFEVVSQYVVAGDNQVQIGMTKKNTGKRR